jgi:putative nucleotidyltransferase with HDIG domain
MTQATIDSDFQNTLLKIWEKLNSTLDLDFILTTAIEYLETVIGAERSSIWEVDENENELFFRLFRGKEKKVVNKIRLKIGEGIAGQCAEKGETIIINDVAKSEVWSFKVDLKTNFKTKSVMSVPLFYRDKVIGVIQLINKISTPFFTEKDEYYVKLMAIPIATALVNAKLFKELEQTFIETSLALADAIEKRDKYTAGHTRRVTEYAMMIAEEINMKNDERKWLALSGILHDIGKIGIRDSILNKTEKLSEEEFLQMQKHTVFGAEIVEKIHSLKKVISGILYHHEKFDGTGYPYGIRENNIPEFARIIAVADTFDAMTTDRPYRNGLPVDVAFEVLEKNASTQFDPNIVNAFKKAYKKRTNNDS